MNGKSNAAVAKWLQKQEWYESFIENLDRFREYDSEDVGRFLDGSMKADTIYLAFPWYLSPEGMDFWREIDNEFAEWYYGEN